MYVCMMNVNTIEQIAITLSRREKSRDLQTQNSVAGSFNRYANYCQTLGLTCLKYFLVVP